MKNIYITKEQLEKRYNVSLFDYQVDLINKMIDSYKHKQNIIPLPKLSKLVISRIVKEFNI